MIDFFEFSHEMLGVLDEQGRLTQVNSAWTTSLGWSAEELVGRSYADLVHPDDLAVAVQESGPLLSGQVETAGMENRYRCRDGSYRWLAWKMKRIPSTSQVVCSAVDVTQQKAQAESLAATEERFRMLATQSEERFRVLVTKAPVIVYQSNEQGQVLFINERWRELTGLSAEESSGGGWQRAIHPADLENLLTSWGASVAAGDEQYVHDFRVVHKNGSIRWLATSAVAIRDPRGQVLSHIGMSIDVTERKMAEEKLRWRESQLAGILDNTPAVVYLKDADGRYLLTNCQFQKLFQHLGDSIIGKSDLDFFPAPTAKKFQESDAKVWRDQVPIYSEEDAPHTDGPHTYRSIKFPVWDESGEMIALGGISTDITDLKEAHEALKIKKDLLQTLIEVQEKEKQFLCHEFHDGLIQYAFGSVMLLESCRGNPHSEDNAAQIDAAIDNLRRGIEDGRRVIRGIRPAVLDNSGLDAALEDLVGQFETSGMHVTSKCDPTIGRLPDSIQTTVYRVVQEALNNAKKYSKTDVVRIELKKVNGDLHLEVRDFGCGFDLEAARQQGFGLLGMTERVRLLGGECLIQSEHDAGTRIFVRLPIHSAKQ